jgi:hypothetical protein
VVAIPLTVRCECGEVHSVDLGDSVRCSCGRTYDTSTLPSAQFARIRAHQAKGRLYVRLGFVFVVGITVLCGLRWGFWGAGVAAPLTALIWFKIIRRWFMRAFVPSPGELPTLELEASNE